MCQSRLKYLAEQVKLACDMPSEENIVKRLNFCIWTESSVRWMATEKWDASSVACGGPNVIEPGAVRKYLDEQMELLAGQECWGGLDLSTTTDLCSLCLLFPPCEGRTYWVALWWYCCPKDTARKRSDKDRVPYDLWGEQGYMQLTPGMMSPITTRSGARLAVPTSRWKRAKRA